MFEWQIKSIVSLKFIFSKLATKFEQKTNKLAVLYLEKLLCNDSLNFKVILQGNFYKSARLKR